MSGLYLSDAQVRYTTPEDRLKGIANESISVAVQWAELKKYNDALIARADAIAAEWEALQPRLAEAERRMRTFMSAWDATKKRVEKLSPSDRRRMGAKM